jgi:pheromone shutdown protein TraB
VETFDDLMKNRFFKVVFVAALANVGAVIASLLGFYIIWQWLGLINPFDLLKGIL